MGEIYNLINFIGKPGFYLGEDGGGHPVTDGNLKVYLDYLKKLYGTGVIDPNWYTQGWEERKAELFAGTYGMCWYPPDALLDENLGSRGDEVADGWWNVLPMFSGALPSQYILGNSILTVSAECAQDGAKMQKIFDMMNTFITPNDEYYELRRSVNIDGQHLVRQDNGTAYVWRDVENFPYKQLDSAEGSFIATAVYGQLFGTYGDGYFGGMTEAIGAYAEDDGSGGPGQGHALLLRGEPVPHTGRHHGGGGQYGVPGVLHQLRAGRGQRLRHLRAELAGRGRPGASRPGHRAAPGLRIHQLIN